MCRDRTVFLFGEVSQGSKEPLGRAVKVVLHKSVSNGVWLYLSLALAALLALTHLYYLSRVQLLHLRLWIKQDLEGVGQLVLDAQVCLGMQQVDEGVGQRDLFVGKGLEHVSAHGDGVMIEQDD